MGAVVLSQNFLLLQASYLKYGVCDFLEEKMGLDNSNKIVVFSDMHFGVIHDPTEDEETNVVDLINLLDLIETEIKPWKIILLGDVFDLWRVKFADAWDNASDIQFFERLSKYVENNKDRGVELIYVIGNHDHFLKEISFGMDSLERYRDIINGKVPQKMCKGLINGIGNLNLNYELKNVKFYYPHYKLEIDEIGTIYFDHGHYPERAERWMKVILAKVYKYVPTLPILSRIFHKRQIKIKKDANPEEICNDLESNFSSLYSLIYYTKFDDVVRAGRDFIWRIKKGRRFLFSAIIGFGLPILINYIFGRVSEISEISKWAIGGGALITALLYSLPKISGKLLSNVVTNTVSNKRGNTVKKVMPEITEKDISMERKNYTYLNLMEECGNDKKKIDHYIFAHTHIAGKIKDSKTDLNIYNCGGWVKEPHGRKCTNSFIIINPESSESEKIKIYRVDERKKIECNFDENGKCDMTCIK